MTSTSSRFSTSMSSGFGFLLLADPTYHEIPPIHPQTASPNSHLATAGLCTGWRPASRCNRGETA